ncbi:MAG: GTP cyclohydrolase I [Betaproteobacteria bacterium]
MTSLKTTTSRTRKLAVKEASDIGIPVSEKIRARLKKAKKRFHANDNIAEFIEPGEIEAIFAEVQEKMKGVLESLVIDTQSDHNTQDTAKRVAKMFVKEVFAGRYTEMPPLTDFPNISHLNELMVVGPISVRSACSHHLCPIMGRVWIGVLPNKNSNLIGLSKYARISEWIMNRPQIQEEAVIQLADILEKSMKPLGLAVVMDADHMCMQWRGIKDPGAKMVNSVMRGVFLKDSDLRKEFLSLLGSRYNQSN